MTQTHLDLSGPLDALREKEFDDPVREFIRFLYQELIGVDSTEHVQAQRHERSLARTAQRNGTRSKTLTTKSGDIDLAIPKLRKGSYFPSFLVRRRRIDQALHAVTGAYVEGDSTRRVDDLFEALGADSGISKSEVSRICATLDKVLEAFRTRDLSHQGFPYLVLDATYVKARVNKRVVSRAVVVAMGVGASGRREILGVAVGDSEDAVFWGEFLASLKARGLSGVQLVISDSHAGLKAAIERYLSGGAAWQRCRVHFKSNVFAKVLRTQASMVSAIISTIFAQPDTDHVEAQVAEVATMLRRSFPEVSTMLLDAAEDITAFRHFPQAHWKKLWSSNAIERLNAAIKQRTRVVGIFPNDAAALRLITTVCVDEHDEWLAAERRYMSQESMELLRNPTATVTPIALATNE